MAKSKYKYEIVNGNEFKQFKTLAGFKRYCVSLGIWTEETSGHRPYRNKDLNHQPKLKNMFGPCQGGGWPIRYEDWATCRALSN
jgi:hypothetical protein